MHVAPGWAVNVVQPPHAFSAAQVALAPLPTQQPVEQELTSQTQDPPVVQSRPVPHFMHAAPPVPHVVLLEFWHRPFWSQQPFMHDVPSHTHVPVALQCCPVLQLPHVLPAVPHCPGASLAKGTHVEPAQHPVVHELAVQAH